MLTKMKLCYYLETLDTGGKYHDGKSQIQTNSFLLRLGFDRFNRFIKNEPLLLNFNIHPPTINRFKPIKYQKEIVRDELIRVEFNRLIDSYFRKELKKSELIEALVMINESSYKIAETEFIKNNN